MPQRRPIEKSRVAFAGVLVVRWFDEVGEDE